MTPRPATTQRQESTAQIRCHIGAYTQLHELHTTILRKELYAGNNAKNVAKAFYDFHETSGYKDWLLYGPLHGNGLMEGEAPWIESNSDFILPENLTFCACLFLGNPKLHIGCRVEDTMRVAQGIGESMTNYPKEIFRK